MTYGTGDKGRVRHRYCDDRGKPLRPRATRCASPWSGLGYVGLPLAVTFGREMETVGFDVDRRRVAELKAGHDRTLEVDDAELEAAQRAER
jgi:hypothetical protein